MDTARAVPTRHRTKEAAMLIIAGKLDAHPHEHDRCVAAHGEITRTARSQPDASIFTCRPTAGKRQDQPVRTVGIRWP
jgi:hypothetical protein